ncbi:hypothetical protein KUD11_11300 [Roseovarius sp. LXJ103]|uniref:hypothetical protein n=1 Tax=Roseovarius carneus TaxID=2853164 RepID=UPI000D604780|nr:hypothetical protein [Roseovarius carneus]MBZ8119229.1 hypothetical protein [Roseovarius carneus]PWE35145.1 hypothetical protein DD563_03680 [Pelagicola sp. LXJ1103]
MKNGLMAMALTLVAAPAWAHDAATGEEIMAAISGNTVQGSMVESGAYTEFYDADGTIKGADYTGTWSVENDQMCFAYGEAPACWSVHIEGDMVTWINDGNEDGTGTLVPGNPNEF